MVSLDYAARPVLREQHRLFVDAWLLNRNAAAAAITAGYAESTARQTASRLLTRDDIRAEIAYRQSLVTERASITALEVVEELANLARSDITDVVTWNGHGLVYEASRDLPPEVTAAIKEVREIRRIHRSKDGSEDETIDFRVVMHDKIAPLVQLARMMGLNPREGGDVARTLNLFIDARQTHQTVEAPFSHITAADTADAMRRMLPLLEAAAEREGEP